MADTTEIRVPDIGDFADVPVIEILVSPGDAVALDDPLLTLESDKATMDVPAPVAGTVGELMVQVGDKVSQGVKLLTLSRSGDGGGESNGAGGGAAPSTGEKASDSVESATQAEAEAAPRSDQGDTQRAAAPAPSAPAPSAPAPSEPAPSAERDGGGPVYASPAAIPPNCRSRGQQ